MKKNISLTIIVLILAVGGFIYLPKTESLLTAAVNLFSPFNDKETETTRLLKETRLEVEKLQEEISLIKEKLEREEGLRVGLELEYQSEMTTLAARLESLAKMVNNFNQEMAQLAIILDSQPEFAEKSCFININTASKEDLQKLTGIGPVLAQGIIDARPFSSIYDLVKVNGIGEATLEKIIEQGCAYADEIDNEEEFIEESIEKETAGICPVNINTASKEELQAITGIGPVLAQKIIDARPFFSIYDLTRISGIGEATLEKIITQDCVFASGYTGGGGGGAPPPPPPPEPDPKINLSYHEENPVNREIEVTLSASNLKNTAYDVKISIENDGNLSQIYNQEKEGEDKWQSSAYYLTEVFFSTSFEGQFRLKIRDDKSDFRGEAEIIARLRETGKTNFLEFKGKINIIEPKQEESEQEEEQEQPEEDPEPPTNLLLNEFFEEWDEPANSANHLYGWEYNGTISHITRDEDGLVENYSVRWTPITTAYNLTQNGINIPKTGTYYAEIWIKPLNVETDNYIRVALDIANPTDGSFANASFIDYKNEIGWVKLTKTREIGTGESGGIRIRAQRSTAVTAPFFLIGVAWLGTAPPPNDWLD